MGEGASWVRERPGKGEARESQGERRGWDSPMPMWHLTDPSPSASSSSRALSSSTGESEVPRAAQRAASSPVSRGEKGQ